MATFRKRGSKWQAQIRLLGRKPLTRTFSSKRDAEAWARQTEATLERGETPVLPRAARSVLMREALHRYRTETTPRKRGADPERYRIGKMMRQPIAEYEMHQISPEAVADYRDQRLREVSNDSVRKELHLLRQVFELARTEWGHPGLANPVAGIGVPKPGMHRVRRLSSHEASVLSKAAVGTRNGVVRDVIEFALMTGMRRSEILRAQWQHVDWTNCTLCLPTSKNGHSRLVPLGSRAIELLKKIHVARMGKDEPIFPVSPNALRLSWERLRTRSGIKDLRFHDLRHEAISSFFERGLSLPEVALISGHRDPRQLMRYTHLDAARIARKLREGGSHADEI